MKAIVALTTVALGVLACGVTSQAAIPDESAISTRAVQTALAGLPTAALPTATSAPTASPEATIGNAPAPSPESTATSPSPNTPPNAVLQSGQAWKKDGLTIMLQGYEPNSNPGLYAEGGTVRFAFAVDNQTGHTITYRIAAGVDYWAKDNLGNLWRPNEEHHTGTVENGEVDHIAVIMIGPVTNPAITDLYFTLNGLGGVENATWDAKLYH